MNDAARSQVARSDLFEIRRMLARSGAFDGYRATPVAWSGAIALAAGALQHALAPGPLAFVALWVATAALCFAINVYGIARTYGASPRQWERSLAFAALLDLMPAIVAGSVLTVALVVRGAPELLPGAWMVLYGGGVLSSRRHVPRGCAWIGLAYVAAGGATLLLLPAAIALRADVMAAVFCVGQLALAWVLARGAGEPEEGRA
ncbi:MAG: hypothetical protein JNL90_03535 [Planctomycetes bacterium]|nr:hypothetical protein [Planctomycetota bacterium]